MRRLVWGIVVPLLGACSLLTSLDGATGGASSAIEAGADDGDAASDGTVQQGERDAGAGACERRPAAIVDGTPAGSVGFTCDLANAAELDGKLAGLDSHSGSSAKVGSESVTSCFEARFDGDIGERVIVHAMAKASACGGGCTGGCEGSPKLKIFAGASSTTLEYVGLVTVDADAGLEPYTVFRKSTEPARIVFVCRASGGSYVDPVVDAVTADCR